MAGYDDFDSDGVRFHQHLPTGGAWSGSGGDDFTVIDEFHRWNAEQVRRHSARLAAARERECRRLAEQKLRPRLRWLVDHLRLLGWVSFVSVLGFSVADGALLWVGAWE